MNTNLILVTNIPKHIKHFDLIKELENKWARLLFIENPYAELNDAFIYNPTSLLTHFEMGVSRLRNKVINGLRPLKVYHLWFPPPNVYLTSLIPDNSTMLPFLFVDNLPKDCDSFEIIGDLPFQTNEVKHWDIPQKEDKWMILRLPINQDEAIRDYVLKYIRTRRLSNGLFPRVLEVFVSEDIRLSKNMIPKSLQILPITSSYKSNLLFLYDLPTKLTVKGISEASKALGVKGSKAFFIDVVDSLRVGFLFVPRSYPEAKFDTFQEALKEKEIVIDNSQAVMLNLNEVYLQAKGALPPKISKKRGDERTVEYVLTNYVHVHNVAACIDHNQLTKGSPINFKVYLFQISDNTTQVGFVCLRGLSDEGITQLIDHLRSLVFEGFPVMVDNIYLKCYDLPENFHERRAVHLPREPIDNVDNITTHVDKTFTDTAEENIEDLEIEIVDSNEEEDVVEVLPESSIEIASEPPLEFNLMKSDFIFVNNLPNTIDYSSFSFLPIEEDALTIMSRDDHRAAFLYYPDTTTDKWINALEKIVGTKIKGISVEVSEVYLQSDETADLLKKGLNMLNPSNYVFVYNIGDCSDTRKLEGNPNIVRFSTMTQESGSCAFVELVSGLSTQETIDTLKYIREINLRGKNLCADLVWLGQVKGKNALDPNELRSRWLKKSEPAKKKLRVE